MHDNFFSHLMHLAGEGPPPDQFRDATKMVTVTIRISDVEARRKAAARLVETGKLKVRVAAADVEEAD